jgi:hypothetical protein
MATKPVPRSPNGSSSYRKDPIMPNGAFRSGGEGFCRCRGSWHCVAMSSGEQDTLEVRWVSWPRWADPLRRSERVVACFDPHGVTFAGRDRIPWNLIQEILQITEKPIRGYEDVHDDQHLLVFSPVATFTPEPINLTERFLNWRHGSPFVLRHEMITPDAQTILAAIRHLTDVPIRDASKR